MYVNRYAMPGRQRRPIPWTPERHVTNAFDRTCYSRRPGHASHWAVLAVRPATNVPRLQRVV